MSVLPREKFGLPILSGTPSAKVCDTFSPIRSMLTIRGQIKAILELQETVNGMSAALSNIFQMIQRVALLFPSGKPNTSTPIKQLAVIPGPATSTDSVRSAYGGIDDSNENVGLQSDHTTPAHTLLEERSPVLPSIVDVDCLNKLRGNNQKFSDYAIRLEQNRGLLRSWNAGEPGIPEGSTYSNVSSTAPGREDQPPSGILNQESTRFEGDLASYGRPNFDTQVLWQLYDSYMQNMHKLHPFLDPRDIRRMIKIFGEQANATPIPGRPCTKRKRSSSHCGELCFLGGAIERSLENSIVLFILALGDLCSYKGKVLPTPQMDSSATAKHARGYTRDFARCNASFDNESSEDRLSSTEVLPGMAYFAYATDIFEYQHGGNTAAHAQAMILAALYSSQYSRAFESWSWIERACRATEFLIQLDYVILRRDIYPKIKASLSSSERYRVNLTMRIYWTCMQLESDIRAELATLPTSSVSRYQNYIMYPEYFEEEKETSTMMMYSSQICLQVVLNECGSHRIFDERNLGEVAKDARRHIHVLESWRKLLSPELAWNDEDPPSTNLNLSQLRAKYYGGLYMILQPYLHIAIRTFSSLSQQNSLVDTTDLAEDQRKVIEIACKCIDAAIQSTIAFDRVGADPDSLYEDFKSTRTERLVVTNISGTLHAQFANIINLTAVAISPLRKYLPSDTKLTKSNLAALTVRTINVLSEGAPNSLALKRDLEILGKVWQQQKMS